MWDRICTTVLALSAGALLDNGIRGLLNHRADVLAYVDSSQMEVLGMYGASLPLTIAQLVLGVASVLVVLARLDPKNAKRRERKRLQRRFRKRGTSIIGALDGYTDRTDLSSLV